MPSCKEVNLQLRLVELQPGMECQHHLETIAKSVTVIGMQYGTSHVLQVRSATTLDCIHNEIQATRQHNHAQGQ